VAARRAIDGLHQDCGRAQPARPRHWRTGKDPFEGAWPEILLWLQADPEATAKSLFERLDREYPGRFPEGQLRTLQRRIREWRRVMARELVATCLGKKDSAAGLTAPGANGQSSSAQSSTVEPLAPERATQAWATD
jgi:hypothetical protein